MSGSEALDAALAPDIYSSSEEYAERFGGRIGQWLLARQKEAFLSLLRPEWQSLLDVGGGHMQIAEPAVRAGLVVTVTGSSAECGRRLGDLIEEGRCHFQVAPLSKLPFPDGAFDVVSCFRQLSHLAAWEDLISELCRVARAAVIIDYPSLRSLNFLQPALFFLKKKIEGNTRPFAIFRDGAVRNVFERAGFRTTGAQRQFFFPMGIHRGLKNVRLSALLEAPASASGLTVLAGSPVVLRAERMPLHSVR